MERNVEIRGPLGVLRGMIHLPEKKDFPPPWPGVVLYHGFTGHRMEPNFLFVRFSRLLLRHGLVSARFDFWGSGESDGSFEEMTLSSEIEDAQAILDWFRRRRGIDKHRIFLLGLSMGGSIAGYVAGQRGGEVRGLVLWAPAGEMKERIRERVVRLQDAQSAQCAPTAPAAPSGDPTDLGGLRLGMEFVADSQSLNILEMSSRYRGKVLIVHGTGDESVPHQGSQAYQKLYGEKARLELIDGADHTFKGLPWSEALFRHSLEFIREG